MSIRAKYSTGEFLPHLVFDFLFCKVKVFGDGSASLHYANERSKKPVYIASVRAIGYMGSNYQVKIPAIGYDMQDEFTQLFANAEHLLLHTFIDYARRTSFMSLPHSDARHRRSLLRALELETGTNEHGLEEQFATGIQLIANGITPQKQRIDEFEIACAFLGLDSKVALPSAIALISYFRAQVKSKLLSAQH